MPGCNFFAQHQNPENDTLPMFKVPTFDIAHKTSPFGRDTSKEMSSVLPP